MLQRERKRLIRLRGTNDPNLTQYQSHGITGSGLYPRRQFGTVTIRRDELFSHRVGEPLPPCAITVFFSPGDQQPGDPEPLFIFATQPSSHPSPSLLLSTTLPHLPSSQKTSSPTHSPKLPLPSCTASVPASNGGKTQRWRIRLSLRVVRFAQIQGPPSPSYGSRQSAREKEVQARHWDLGLAQNTGFNF